MTSEIPPYGMRAYAWFFTKHGTKEAFSQAELDWMVSQSMKKKIFALLLKSGWIQKKDHTSYTCVAPEKVMNNLLEFKVPEIMKKASRDYAFTGNSAIEIWSDFVYVQRGIEKSPYFIKVLQKDIKYWSDFFNKNNTPHYISQGSTIGEYVILIPVNKIGSIKQKGIKVESLKETIKMAHAHEIYKYAYHYMRKKYGTAAA